MEKYSAFRSEELWRPSIFTLDADPDGSIFDSLQLDASPALLPKPTDGNLFDGISDDLGLPPLEDLSPDTSDELPAAEVLDAKPNVNERPTELDDHDVWTLDESTASPPSEPQFLTWEAFERKADQPAHPFYLTEAGDDAFDAVFQQREQSEGVLPHDAVLRACFSLVLGRSSIFFRWDAAKGSFCPVLDKVAISGFSLFATRTLTDTFAETGLAFRELGAFVSNSNARDCTSMVALKRCFSVVLDRSERQICEQIPHTRSLLQLQEAIERPSRILSHLRAMVKVLGRLRNDEDLISALSDEVTRLAESGSIASNVMQQILAHISMPWLQRLAEDTGLAPRLCTIQDPAAIQDAADAEPGNHFIAPEDISIISNVKRSINLLREHVSEHPLANTDRNIHERSAQLSTQIVDVESVVQRAAEYKVQMESAILKQRRELGATPHDMPSANSNLSIEHDDIFSTSALGDLASMVEQDISTNMPESEDIYGSLQNLLTSVFDDQWENQTEVLSSKIDLLAPLRPFIEVQASLVNDAVADYLFNTFKLRDHLDLHRSYHLFGNGDFVTRLTTALFSDEVQSAERKRGNIPTSETMGLRLGSREVQRWPPASSELRLTLLNVLSESYAPGSSNDADLHLPGGLSFAIRELSDAEIDKVMDPTSIHALDFLRLQYTPPPPLAPIFTPTVLQHYDAIFRSLLIHARVLHATANLRPWPRQPKHANNTVTLRRFAWKARHFSTTLLSHFTETAIAPAWKAFAQRLDEAQSAPQTASLSSLAEAHALTLASIRAKLFLRRKQEPLRRVVEAIAELVVKAPAGAGMGIAERERRFDELCEELRGLLEGLAVKRGARGEEAGVGVGGLEREAAGLLGRRLRWGGEGEGK